METFTGSKVSCYFLVDAERERISGEELAESCSAQSIQAGHIFEIEDLSFGTSGSAIMI